MRARWREAPPSEHYKCQSKSGPPPPRFEFVPPPLLWALLLKSKVVIDTQIKRTVISWNMEKSDQEYPGTCECRARNYPDILTFVRPVDGPRRKCFSVIEMDNRAEEVLQILRTISSFLRHQKILFLSRVMPLKICDTSPRLSISIEPSSYLLIISPPPPLSIAGVAGVAKRPLVTVGH